MRLRHPGRDRPLPDALDAVAFCALPLALRSRQALHIAGPVTRSALRNLRELGEAWANWDPDRFAAVEITCDRVIDGGRASGGSCIAAWSGDLRSTFAITGGDEALVRAGHRIDTAVHLTGLARAGTPEPTLAPLAAAFATIGVDLAVVTTDAAETGFLDPVIGATPLVMAALHLVGDGLFATAVHADAVPIQTQIIRPRPRPTLGDLYSGDHLSIMATGATASAPRMVRHIVRTAGLGSLLRGCRATGMAAPRCGHCADCRTLTLGLCGAGIRLPDDRCSRISLDPGDGDMESEAILALADWSGRPGTRLGLAARLVIAATRRALRDRAIWRLAMAGKVDPWPR